MTTPTSQELIHTYRHLYRNGLHAVQFSKPGRYIIRDRLRYSFRKGDPSSFNQAKINNTLEFLRLAGKEAGLEHRIVKNLVHTTYAENVEFIPQINPNQKNKDGPLLQQHLKSMSRLHYRVTLAMLNDSMNLCL